MTKKLQRTEYGISTFKGLVGAIPFAGTLLNEYAFEARSRIKQERVNKFVIEFSEFINKNSEEKFELETLNVEQISDVFEEIIISISKTSAEHKKTVFKQILLKQLLSNEIETDETMRFINIINELTKAEFEILSAFHDLSDNVLKYKVQILELEAEKKDLETEISDMNGAFIGNDTKRKRIEERISKIQKLIRKRRTALQSGNVNPNYHTTFNLTREVYIAEIQDLISKGLLFDFALRTKIIDPFVHFGITSLGRSFMNYVSE